MEKEKKRDKNIYRKYKRKKIKNKTKIKKMKLRKIKKKKERMMIMEKITNQQAEMIKLDNKILMLKLIGLIP